MTLYEIWNSGESAHPFRAQMKNYVAQFETEEQARRYVSAMQKIEQQGVSNRTMTGKEMPKKSKK